MRSLYDNRFAGTLAHTLRRFSACACFFMFFILLECKQGEIRLIKALKDHNFQTAYNSFSSNAISFFQMSLKSLVKFVQ